MKTLSQYITEYLIKKKVDKVKDNYKYHPQTKQELIENIKELLDKGETNLNCICVNNITDMSDLFSDLYFSDKIFDISKWDTYSATNMNGMFTGCEKFNCDLSNWDVSKVENMHYMFTNCKNFEGKGLEKWNTKNVNDMTDMFAYCGNFTGKTIENWNVSNVENMRFMFNHCDNLDCDLSKWDVSNVKDMNSMFFNCSKFNCDLSNWDVSKVEDMQYMFTKCKNFKGIGLEKWNINAKNKNRFAFSNCISMKNKPSWYK